MNKIRLLFLVIILTISGCAAQDSAYIRNGKQYGVTSGLFRDRWWNYYERGLSFAEGEFYAEAVEDLQSAIDRRTDDQWRSRTYGMHFVNYFPHRELGIVYYRTKRYHEAEQELQTSLNTAESTKAKYYLNKARRAILEESGADSSPPTIRLISPADRAVTNKIHAILKGEVEDDYFVSSVRIDGVPLFLELSAKRVPLEEEVSLKRGMNEIVIRASDLTGKVTEKKLRMKVDREGPVIIIGDQKTEGRKMILSGFVTDGSGIASFMINNKSIPVEAVQRSDKDPVPNESGVEIEFNQEIDLPEGAHNVIVKVEDTASNVTTGKVSVDYGKTDPAQASGLDGLTMLASADTGVFMDRYAGVADSLRKLIDNIPPEIHLKDLLDIQTVYTDSLYLEGSVSDASNIISLFINGESILKRVGKRVFFNYLTRLREGVNRFFIKTGDTYGNTSEKIITVNRKVAEVRRLGSRMSVSVLPMELKGKGSVPGNAYVDSLISAFVNQRRFQLVEREKMKEVLKELRLSQSELADPDTASKIGKIVLADAMLSGTVYETENSVEIFTRFVDTETSQIIEAKDVYGENKSLRGIKTLMEGLALKYKQSFPLLEGAVLKRDGKNVLIDLGNGTNLKEKMYILLFKEGDAVRHPATGKLLGSEPVELGEAKVENVYDEFSKAVIVKGKPENIDISCKIITK